MKLSRSFLAGVITALLTVAACSSHITSVPTPPPPGGGGVTLHQFGFSAIPTHGTLHTAVKQAASNFTFSDSLYAQSAPSIVMTGDYNGYCPTVSAPSASQGVALVMYGAGSLSQANCSTTTGAEVFTGAGTDPGNDTALNTQQGALVIGNGTLGGLVVVDSASSIVADGSGLVEVWVLRGGQVLPTGISATLGSNREVQDPSDTFAVLDQDQIIVTMTVTPTDQINNVQWFLGKQ